MKILVCENLVLYGICKAMLGQMNILMIMNFQIFDKFVHSSFTTLFSLQLLFDLHGFNIVAKEEPS